MGDKMPLPRLLLRCAVTGPFMGSERRQVKEEKSG